MGRKTIKGSSMIFLMLLLILAIAFGSVATTFLNSTVFENEATPKYYSAVKDCSLVNNTADSQNVFSYEFALDGANPLWDYMTVVNWNEWYTGNTDYTHFYNLSYDEWATKFKKDSFKSCLNIYRKVRGIYKYSSTSCFCF